MPKAAILALIFAQVCTAQVPSAQQKGSISGTVTNAAGEPLKSATLRLQNAGRSQNTGARGPQQQPQIYAASSDAQGNFTFEDLEPGRYYLSSEKAGYLRAIYSDSSKSVTLDLTSSPTLTGIAIRMTPQALISGTITDEDGEPYPNIFVRLARWAYVGGQRRLQPSVGASSNAEGVFSIGNLAAGSYYVTANPLPMSSVIGVRKGPEEAYVATYYPGTADPASAVAVQVAAGGAARGIDIRMHKTRAFRVRGKLVDLGGGAAPANANVVLVPKDGPTLPGPTPNATMRDGAFVFAAVLPGVYVLQSMPGGADSGMARQIVTVGNADVDDLVLQLGPGAEITGTISIDGPPLQPQQPGMPGANVRPTVFLNATDGVRGSFQQPQTNDDGTFAAHHIMPGTYQVSVQALPPGTYVKSIHFGSLDLMKTPLDLIGGSGGAISVVLSPKAGDIGGIVHGAEGMPLASALVSLWTPGVPAEGVADFTRTAETDASGRFKFDSLPPGEYRIAAWEQIDPGLDSVPEFRIKFESKAAAVKLDENAHENIEAPLILHDAIETEAAKLQ